MVEVEELPSRTTTYRGARPLLIAGFAVIAAALYVVLIPASKATHTHTLCVRNGARERELTHTPTQWLYVM